MSARRSRNKAIEEAIQQLFVVVRNEVEAERFSGTSAMVILTYDDGTHLHSLGAAESDDAYAKAIETLQKRIDGRPAFFKKITPMDKLQ